MTYICLGMAMVFGGMVVGLIVMPHDSRSVPPVERLSPGLVSDQSVGESTSIGSNRMHDLLAAE